MKGLEMERVVKEQVLDWMNEGNEYKRKQIDVAAMVLTDVLREIGVLKAKPDENGNPMLYISFGKYAELYGICHDYDDDNEVWSVSIYQSICGGADLLLCGQAAKGEVT